MKRRIRWTALVLAVCLLALTGCAQQRDTHDPAGVSGQRARHPGPRYGGPPTPSARWYPICLRI